VYSEVIMNHLLFCFQTASSELYTNHTFQLHIHFDCNSCELRNSCKNMADAGQEIRQDAGRNQDVKSIKIPQEMEDRIFSCKSVAIYEKWHQKFINFISEKDLPENLESIMCFFNEISSSYSPSTLWQCYSCLNKYYSTYKSWQSFNDIPALKNFLKAIEKDSTRKQSLILSKEELFTFFNTAPNDGKNLVRKAIAVVGYFGGLRCSEMLNLDFNDVTIDSENITIFIRFSKTDPNGQKKFYFTIPKTVSDGCPYKIVQDYITAVCKRTGRFFQNFNFKSKQFVGQPMGRNTLSAVPKYIAAFLGLENAEKYTGHCLRRSSATALADSGATTVAMKRQFRWKSETVAQSYVGQSKIFKTDVANSLGLSVGVSKCTSNSTSGEKVVNISNCSNVVINL